MFKNHPKGLVIAFFTNMGERFGFYTMMACLVFYLQAKYNMNAANAGDVYSWFYFGIYAAALIGGLVADGTRNYKRTIFFGIITMLCGYVIMSIPGMGLSITIAGLAVIALGNGLFKGNLQAVVGQMYDDPKYEKLRDSAFSVFYMGINMGALIAPFAANGIRNWFLRSQGLSYDADLQVYASKFNIGELSILNTDEIIDFAEKSSSMMAKSGISGITTFVREYLNSFATGYNYAFGIAALSMVVSFIVYVIYKRRLPDVKKEIAKPVQEAETSSKINESKSIGIKIAISLGAMAVIATIFQIFLNKLSLGLAIGLFFSFISWIYLSSKKEERPKLNALLLVFAVVIFFWMSFHQNGLTLSMFARDYVANQVNPVTNLLFTFPSLLCIFAFILGLIFLINKNSKLSKRLIGCAMVIVGIGVGYYIFSQFDKLNSIEPEIFQSFNPIFIVFLTPVIILVFTKLRQKNIEPSAPKKIGIGMILAAMGFVVMIISSFGLLSPSSLGGAPSPDRISVYWLINTYLILTIAELFLSPMGLSFVSKVSPKRFQGLMQGGWLLATAVGNKLLFIGSSLWEKIELWQLWLIFVCCCIASALVIFSIIKKLEKATK